MRVADADLLQADEHADAVVDVDDEVADLQVAQVRQKRLRGRSAPLGRAALFFEDVGFGVDLQAGVGQPEAARQPADRDQHRRVPRVLGAIDRHREDVVFLQQLDGPFGAARRRRDEQRGVAVVAQPADLGDPVGHPAVQLDGRLTSGRAVTRRCSSSEAELRETASPRDRRASMVGPTRASSSTGRRRTLARAGSCASS